MQTKKLLFYSLVVAVIAVIAYQLLVPGRALVELQVETDNRTMFRIYYKETGEPWTQEKVATVPIWPDRSTYSFRMGSLGKIDELRIDTSEKPAVVTIKSLVFSQVGRKTLRFADAADFAKLTPIEGIASIDIDQGMTVTPSSNDPQLLYSLEERLGYHFSWGHVVTPAALFFLAGLLVYLLQPLFVDYKFSVVFGCGIFFLIVVMAVVSAPYKHPDEHVHVKAGQYYLDHSLPPAVGDETIIDTYSTYGVSRLHSGEIAYFIAGKFASLFTPLHIPEYLLFRLFNAALFAGLVFFSIRSVPMRMLLVPLMLSPQIWYVFSYFNSDAFAVFVMVLAAYQCISSDSWLNKLIDPEEDDIPILRTVLLGVLFAMVLLTKVNYYFFMLFMGCYLLWRWLFTELECTKTTIMRLVAMALVGGVLFGCVRGVDQYVNGFEKSDRILAAREQFAGPMFKPSTPLNKKFAYLQMRERGVSLRAIMDRDRWGEKMFRSAFGEYGYMTVPASLGHYDLVRYSGFGLILVLLAAILARGGLAGWSLTAFGCGCAGLLMGAALYHAWTVDFQAQGRYLFPIAGMLGILLFELRKSVENLSCCLALTWFVGLSFYSFIFIALAGIAKIAMPFG